MADLPTIDDKGYIAAPQKPGLVDDMRVSHPIARQAPLMPREVRLGLAWAFGEL
jgi:hypothetical protein